MPAEKQFEKLSGRGTDSQFAQNPLPLAMAIGRGLAKLHCSAIPGELEGQTRPEADAAVAFLSRGGDAPSPFGQVRTTALIETLASIPAGRDDVLTHGSPIVDLVIVNKGVATFEDARTSGRDPAERDLAILFRSVAETFTSEVCATVLDGYVDAGGALPHSPTLDWYGVVAAFR